MERISRVIYSPVFGLQLEIHARLMKDNEGRIDNFHQIFEINGKEYMRIDLQSYLILKMFHPDNKKEFDKTKSIMINQRNLIHIIEGFEEMVKNMIEGKMFAQTPQGEIIIYSDTAKEKSVSLYNLGDNNRLRLVPIIFKDRLETTYEGVRIYFNKDSNFVDMPFDSFKALTYTLSRADVFVYSQQLLTYYMTVMATHQAQSKSTESKSEPIKPVPKKIPRRPFDIPDTSTPSEPKVKGINKIDDGFPTSLS